MILGERFAIVGALGTGGTATVYLAVDQLRGMRIALKVVHPHLATDGAVRRRIQREVRAATVLQHDAALVPWDVHEVDGQLCLAMPYHEGQTLSEHVAATGPLEPSNVRALGVRIASALAEAHRGGLLHRDVTGNNVLLKAGSEAVITDFGLSRTQSDATKSTGMLGTAGYAAPEIYAGERADPRADLYGLGCVMYLAVTGKTPFGTANPMATLQKQLADDFVPVKSVVPSCPTDLAETIEALIRQDRGARPQGAREVLDALQSQRSPSTPDPPRSVTSGKVHLEPGDCRVVVTEQDHDRARRRQRRVERRAERPTIETEVSRRARELMTGVLTYVGLNSANTPTPEELLVRSVAEESQTGAELALPPAVFQKRFVLVDSISESAALRIQAEARSAGFHADLVNTKNAANPFRRAIVTALLVCGWVGLAAVPIISELLFFPYLLGMIAFSILFPLIAGQGGGRRVRNHTALPVAFEPDLSRWMSTPVAGKFPVKASPKAPTASPSPPLPVTASRGQHLLSRASGQLDALEATIAELDLNAVAASDMRDTARDLRNQAEDLASEIDRLDRELAIEPEDTGWIEPRLARLATKERAGEAVDAAEVRRLEESLEAHRRAELLTATLESQLTAATAGLLEIASTATRVRRELMSQPDSNATAGPALQKLKDEAAAADRARREMARRARKV